MAFLRLRSGPGTSKSTDKAGGPWAAPTPQEPCPCGSVHSLSPDSQAGVFEGPSSSILASLQAAHGGCAHPHPGAPFQARLRPADNRAQLLSDQPSLHPPGSQGPVLLPITDLELPHWATHSPWDRPAPGPPGQSCLPPAGPLSDPQSADRDHAAPCTVPNPEIQPRSRCPCSQGLCILWGGRGPSTERIPIKRSR